MRDQLPTHQKLLLVIGYHLGMRRGEILSLRWDQVDGGAGLIRLSAKQAKAKTGRVAPLYGELRASLEIAYGARQQKDEADREVGIVSWRGQGIKGPKTGWQQARERAELPGLLVHDLRRTAVRNMMRAGIPEQQAMLISWHKTTAIFRRYNITDERDIGGGGRENGSLYGRSGKGLGMPRWTAKSGQCTPS